MSSQLTLAEVFADRAPARPERSPAQLNGDCLSLLLVPVLAMLFAASLTSVPWPWAGLGAVMAVVPAFCRLGSRRLAWARYEALLSLRRVRARTSAVDTEMIWRVELMNRSLRVGELLDIHLLPWGFAAAGTHGLGVGMMWWRGDFAAEAALASAVIAITVVLDRLRREDLSVAGSARHLCA